MKQVSIETVLKIAAIVFAAGMMYQTVQSSGERTRMQIDTVNERIDAQKERLQRIEDYLDAIRRNGL